MFHHDPQLSGALSAHFRFHDTMFSGMTLPSGASLVSATGTFRATMQLNGVLAVTSAHTLPLLRWSKASEAGRCGPEARQRQLVGTHTGGVQLWASRAYPAKRTVLLVMGSDGHLQMRVHNGNEWANDVVLWSSLISSRTPPG